MTTVPFTGGRRIALVSATVGVLGLAATAIASAVVGAEAIYSYLTGFVFWLGIALGALILLMVLHASHARWVVVIRRVLEAMAVAVLPFAVLFVPIALCWSILFGWLHPQHPIPVLERHMYERKALWLEPRFFVVRAIVYFAIWIAFSWYLWRWSCRQDRTGDLALTEKQRRLGAGGLPAVGFSMTFAAFDWLMCLQPNWHSTIFGVYYFAGSFVAAIAIYIIVVAIAERRGMLAGLLRKSHWHSLGKLLLAFTCFWAYIAFSQLLLVWIANLPEEVPWYIVRWNGPWGVLAVLLIFGHFVVPFFLLLSKPLKMKPARLAAVAALIVGMHWVDLYWFVMPMYEPGRLRVHFTDLTAFVGIGGVAIAFAAWALSRGSVVPERDPYIDESLRYSPP